MTVKDLWGLVKAAASGWVDDYAQSMGAALAYYTMFSIAPLLLIVISIAGLVFGDQAARGEIFSQLEGMLGAPGALAVQGLLESVRKPTESVTATVFGVVLLLIGATSVFGELQDALDRIWRAPDRAGQSGFWGLIRARLLSFGMILGIGFLLMVSLVASAALAALRKWWGPVLGDWAVAVSIIELCSSLLVITVVFAMIYKISAARAHRLEGCLDRRGSNLAAVHGRQVPDWRLHREERHCLKLRCRGVSGPGAGLGLLLGPDLLARCRVHLGVRAPIRFPKGPRVGESIRRAPSSDAIPQPRQECPRWVNGGTRTPAGLPRGSSSRTDNVRLRFRPMSATVRVTGVEPCVSDGGASRTGRDNVEIGGLEPANFSRSPWPSTIAVMQTARVASIHRLSMGAVRALCTSRRGCSQPSSDHAGGASWLATQQLVFPRH